MTSVAMFELVLLLVGAAVALSLLAGRVHLPPATALVLGGMGLALTPGVPAFSIDPDLVMVLFLPPLLMASAYFTVWRDFKEQLRPILLLSVGAVVFTTFVVGCVAKLVMPSLPWAACFTLGAIVSPPDAVAAKAVLQRLKLPERLVTILEGESLVNDASGLVLYKFAVVAALTGSFSATSAGVSFVWLIIGGIGFGALCGYAWTQIARRLHDARTMIVTSFLGSWISYIFAEQIHASGVLATVACGCVVGLRSHETLVAHVRMQANAVWSFVVFVMEALVFVLIGLALRGVLHRNGGDMEAVGDGLPLACAVTATVVLTRFVWVYPAAYLPRMLSPHIRARDGMPPWQIPIIIGWAGMRGVVTLMAALALPMDFPGRDAILFAAFVVILFTVIVQGTTLGPLVVALRLQPIPTMATSLLDLTGTRIAVNQAALMSLEALVAKETGDPLHPRLIEDYQRRVRAVTRFRDEGELLDMERRDHFAAALLAVESGRSELIRLHHGRKIHDSVLRTIESELDLEELRLKRLADVLVE